MPIYISTYNFRFSGPNFRLVDLKSAILWAHEGSNWSGKFGKNINNLCLHNFVKGSTNLFVNGFSRLRLVDLKITF